MDLCIFLMDDFFQISSSKLPLDLFIMEAADHNCSNQHQSNKASETGGEILSSEK